MLLLTTLPQVLFQSSRPVPVMLVGIALLKKRYTLLEYLATFLLIVGLVLFSKADAATSATFSMFGASSILIACCNLNR